MLEQLRLGLNLSNDVLARARGSGERMRRDLSLFVVWVVLDDCVRNGQIIEVLAEGYYVCARARWLCAQSQTPDTNQTSLILTAAALGVACTPSWFSRSHVLRSGHSGLWRG